MSCLGGFGKWICVFLGNISLCFLWDFDYFVETYLEVVNLLIKMRILLSVICSTKVFLAIWFCLCYFLINEFKCASWNWGFDGGFWQIDWCCCGDISGFV